MPTINLVRTGRAHPANLEPVREVLFGSFDGFSNVDRRAWRRFWKRLMGLGAGEMACAEMRFPRSGPYHRRHMAIESAVFDAQEKFDDFEIFRAWLKVGGGWVTWCAGPKGGVVPIPKSISYREADQEEFTRYHEAVMRFLRGGHAADFLWRHLKGGKADEMMESILAGFNE